MIWTAAKWILMGALAFSLGMLSGCGTGRGAAALGGGFFSDGSKVFQYILDHTNEDQAPRYQGIWPLRKD